MIKPVLAAFTTAGLIFGGQTLTRPFEQDILQHAEDASVILKIPQPETDRTASCTGFFINNRGDMMTANHCIDEKTKAFDVILSDGSDKTGKLVYTNAELDFSVIHMDLTGNAFIPWGSSDALKTGDRVFVVGDPFDVGMSVSSGIVSAPMRVSEGSVYFQTDAALNHGNSGGAVINERGEVVGLADAIISNARQSAGIGLVVPASMIRRKLDSLRFL